MTSAAEAATAAATAAPTRLWDLPVRLVHWGFVILLAALWWTAENHRIALHVTLGLVTLGLLLFRIIWGFAGSSTARFAEFVKGPAAIRTYLRGLKDRTGAHVVGHNPLGGLSVIALLGLLALQVGLGLFAQDDDGQTGPLNYLVSYDTAKAITEVHEVVFNVILALVVLHVAAILYYRFVKRDDLVTPMITGRRTFDAPVTAPRIASPARAVLCAIVAAAIAVWVSYGLPPFATPFPWDRTVPAVEPADYM